MASIPLSHWRPSRPSRRDGSVFRLPAPARTALKIGVVTFGLLACVEVGIRGVELWQEQPLGFVANAARLPTGAVVGGRTVNTLGYVDDEFDATVVPGKVRVALLGGRATLAGDAVSNIAAQLERHLPGVEIDHFGVPEGNPRRYAAQLRSEVLSYRPQFVLLCLSPADDLAAIGTVPGTYDVRLLQLTNRWLGSSVEAPDAAETLVRLTETLDYETYVRRRTAPVAVCRSGDDLGLDGRWQAAQASLLRMARRCRDHEIGFAIVLAPSEFQLNPTLAEALRRRAGVEADRFDVDLPQRRWTALTDHLQLPSLDLLPTFRSASTVLYEPSSPDWNEAGRTLAAEATAHWLQSRFDVTLAASDAR